MLDAQKTYKSVSSKKVPDRRLPMGTMWIFQMRDDAIECGGTRETNPCTTSFANYLLAMEQETVRRRRPLARRRARTLRPSLVDILSRKPCLLTLFLLEGWKVLFIAV